MELNELYNEIIMEHVQSGHSKRHIDGADVKEHGHNPSCGDDLTLEIKFNGDLIEDAAFTGVGCAISQASASIMVDLIKGKNKKDALHLIETFIGMIKREIKDEDELQKLEDALILKNISNMPARVKCATLAWHTSKQAIK